MVRLQNWLSRRQRPTNFEDAVLDYLRHGSDLFVEIESGEQNEIQRRAIEMLSYSALVKVRRTYGVMLNVNDGYDLRYEIQATGNYYYSNAVLTATRCDWPPEWGSGPVQEIWGPIISHRLTPTGLKGKEQVLAGGGGRIPGRITHFCATHHLPPADISFLSKKANRSAPNSVAMAAAQANPTINNQINVQPPVVNVTVTPPPVNITSGQSTEPEKQGNSSPAKKQRHTEWRKVYDMLAGEGEPEDRQDFVARYNKKWSNKTVEGSAGEQWPSLDLKALAQRILDWRKMTK